MSARECYAVVGENVCGGDVQMSRSVAVVSFQEPERIIKIERDGVGTKGGAEEGRDQKLLDPLDTEGIGGRGLSIDGLQLPLGSSSMSSSSRRYLFSFHRSLMSFALRIFQPRRAWHVAHTSSCSVWTPEAMRVTEGGPRSTLYASVKRPAAPLKPLNFCETNVSASAAGLYGVHGR